MNTGSQAHPGEEELVLHFYGEGSQPSAIQTHLAFCKSCAAEYEAIAATMTLVSATPVPERGDLYGLEVWQRIRPVLPAPAPFWKLPRNPMIFAATLGALIVAAFVAGTYWPRDAKTTTPAAVSGGGVRLDADARARTAAIADHLERSERMLLDLSNAEGATIDVSVQQAWASDLVDANRLYRDAAVQAGDTSVASVLDDLERNLLDIVHAPSTLTPAELETVRTRLDAAALLFKVRVLSNELRDRESAPVALRKTT